MLSINLWDSLLDADQPREGDQKVTNFPDTQFNAAVMSMANRVCPAGYDVVDAAPTNLRQLQLHIEQTGRIAVDRRNSARTIFGCPEHNWAFRAWHDWSHWVLRAEFDLNGELSVAHRQCEDLTRAFGHGATVASWHRIIMAEVYGQVLYHKRHGIFPEDQVAFDLTWLDNPALALAGSFPPPSPAQETILRTHWLLSSLAVDRDVR